MFHVLCMHINGKMEAAVVCWDSIVYWAKIARTESKMETSLVYWGNRDNGKENGNYYSILG